MVNNLRTIILRYFSVVFFVLISLKVVAQPINDECANATFLPNISNYCSGTAAFSNSASTASGFGLPACWTANATEDIWFTFTAIGTDALISASGTGNGGTMIRPRITVYFGSCAGTINQLACSNGTAGSGTTQLYQGALLPGTVYLIRISTTTTNEGSFELCINNYTPSSNPGADCNGAAFICNDNPLSVAALTGGGLNNDEPESSSCMEDPFGPDEGNSSWYYWQAGTSGLFAFDIIPVNSTDDIDFIVYQLGGSNPCGARSVLRCNASACLNVNGSTGLDYSDPDITEDINCDPGENSYCAPINMVAGTYYALLVNNFSTSSGYTINFNTIPNGGTIRGPSPVITANPISICAGRTVTFSGTNSTNVGGGLSWNFNNGGSPTSAVGTGPHQVTYSAPGNYTAILNGTDIGGCVKTESIIINVTAPPSASLVSQTNVACFGGSNGAIDINVTGGVAAYTYNWGAGVNSQDRNGLAAGTYTVTVTDANLCTTTRSVTISQPSQLNTNTVTITDATCQTGGSINITAGGGTPGYTYLWSNGAVTEDVSGVIGGNYSVTITDANLCTIVNANNVVPTVGIPGLNISNTNVSCFLGNNGTINLTVNGGTAPFSYNWGSGITTEDRSGLSAGPYTVTITDNNGCTGTVSATITEPSVLSSSLTQSNVLCFGGTSGSVNLSVSGGTSTYNYDWGSGITTEDRSSLSAGSYDVTITDANGCTSTNTVTITEPTALSSNTITVTDATCLLGGTVNINVSGGAGNYNYQWSSGASTEDLSGLAPGTYNVTISDANSCTIVNSNNSVLAIGVPSLSIINTNVTCFSANNGTINVTTSGGVTPYSYNWGSGITTEDRTGLAAGVYSVTLTDNNGCSGTVSATVTEPSLLSSTTTQNNILCFGASTGSVDLTVNGGTTSYLYNWGSGITSEDINSLSAGVYSVTVTDANGCTTSNAVTLTEPTSLLTTTLSVTDSTCLQGGTVNVDISGGAGSYTYLWSNGAVSEDLSGLTGGTYSVTITDANSCTVVNSNNIVQAIGSPSLSINNTNVSCFGGNNGSIDITVNGGAAPYIFNWGGAVNSEDRTNLTAGSYTVTLTDNNGCTGTISALVTEPSVIIINNVLAINSTCGLNNGSISLDVNGGTIPYSYAWSSGEITEDLTAINSATYTLTVTDNNNCISITTVNISTTTALNVNLTTENEACNSPGSGFADISVVSGTAPFVYQWSSGQNQPVLNNVNAGNYFVTITDANNCSVVESIVITSPLQPQNDAFILPSMTVDSTVSLGDLINLSGNNNQTSSGVSYQWTALGAAGVNFSNPNGLSTTVNPAENGDYTIILTSTSTDGCVSSDTLFITVESTNPVIPTAFSPNGDGNNEIFQVVNLNKDDILEFQIFNRWGQKIFDNNTLGYWDGTYNGVAQPRDVYMFVIKWKRPFDSDMVKRGHVTLLR